MPLPLRRLSRSRTSVSLCAVLSACGGGGGTTSLAIGLGATVPANSVQPVPSSTTPLQLTASNAKGATTLAFGYGALTVAIGQLAVDWTAQAESSATLSLNQACPGGGTATISLCAEHDSRWP